MNRALRETYVLVAIFITMMATLACTDDISVSNDVRHRLTFSDDTIAFDTLFTHVGSATAAFKVLNKTSANLKLADIVLAGGKASPFRVNVDGRYDTRWSDVDLRAGDSIWVFAEVTMPDTDDTEPYEAQDSLLFRLTSGVQQRVLLTASGWNATELRGVILTDDYTMLAGRPYIIYDSLVVAAGSTLTVEPGAFVCFHSGAYLGVDGSVSAVGTLEKPIVWRGDRLDNLLSYLPYDFVNGQWGGIELRNSAANNVFIYCDIHSSDYGIRAQGSTDEEGFLTLENTQVHNTTGNGLQLTLLNGHAYNCLFTNAGGHCVSLLGGTFDFVHCTIANFYFWSGGRDTALDICNVRNDTIFPLRVTFTNCIVTGLGDDELSGQVVQITDSTGNLTAAHYLFSHSLLNTPREENAHFESITWESPDSTFWGEQHFAHALHRTSQYDFHLTAESPARGIGTTECLHLCPTDKDGIARTDSIDAGCYQFLREQTAP